MAAAFVAASLSGWYVGTTINSSFSSKPEPRLSLPPEAPNPIEQASGTSPDGNSLRWERIRLKYEARMAEIQLEVARDVALSGMELALIDFKWQLQKQNRKFEVALEENSKKLEETLAPYLDRK